jgi:hypothetical protein
LFEATSGGATLIGSLARFARAQEIAEACEAANCKWADRPDIVSRVFRLKLKELQRDLKIKQVLGKAIAYLDVIEWQKRGLPHAHILVILRPEDRILTSDGIDEVVSAELPIEPVRTNFAGGPAGARKFEAATNAYERLLNIVLNNMIHRDCSKGGRPEPCIRNDGNCKSGFPHDFAAATQWCATDIYPKYRRRAPAGDQWQALHDERVVDNSWVVPHNRALLLKYDCHINVEVPFPPATSTLPQKKPCRPWPLPGTVGRATAKLFHQSGLAGHG